MARALAVLNSDRTPASVAALAVLTAALAPIAAIGAVLVTVIPAVLR